MARIILIAADCRSKANFLESCSLPDFYMQDFSIQGIAVDDFPAARHLLSEAGYTVLDKSCGADIFLGDVLELRTILDLLNQHDIFSELTDIADSLYQA